MVTGARIKIGFAIALKLLRCGANVYATTRFTCDALERFHFSHPLLLIRIQCCVRSQIE